MNETQRPAEKDARCLAAVEALERRWTAGPGPNPRWLNELREALAGEACHNEECSLPADHEGLHRPFMAEGARPIPPASTEDA